MTPRHELPLTLRGRDVSVAHGHRPGSGETLLYLHGLGGTQEDFADAWWVPDWCDHELVAFDAPGCGASEEPGEGDPLLHVSFLRPARVQTAPVAGLEASKVE